MEVRVTLGLWAVCGVTAWPAQAVPDFNREVRPILSDNCFACHGPDQAARKADLRLDTEAGIRNALKAGESGTSELLRRVESRDPEEQMPPPDSHLSLSVAERTTLRRWVAGGAPWEGHWSFQPIPRPTPPNPRGDPWSRSPIDSFVYRNLANQGLKPAVEADRLTWLRRVTQDLTGLPPSLADITAFEADTSEGAQAAVVDRLLQSTDFAERMTGRWLDLARYADSNGYQFDNARTMWPWRDWVIEAFRNNMPFDQFVTEQLAGDLLEDPSEDQLIATGFNRNHGYSIEGGIIDEEYRVTYANDKTATFGTVFLGLTLDCARCHDHKYDPVSMEEYYSLFAFFNTSAEAGAPGEKGFKQKASAPFIEWRPEPASTNTPPVRVMVMREQPRETFLLEQGLFDQPGRKVLPRTPASLPAFEGYPTNRLGLAQWLTADQHPLFARVTVNRIWEQFFGRGLVKSSDNFGLQGALPTHPELLDWLASELRDTGWDLRHLIRSIVLSSTYRQSSNERPALEDPDNALLARGPRFRLPAELIRDQALAASGLLQQHIGGPSVFPYQPEGVWEDLNAPQSHREVYQPSTGDGLYRKSLYTYWRRATLHPALAAFDAPSRDVCSVSRTTTNTPLQALITLHGPTYVEASRVLADQEWEQEDAVAQVFRRILTRKPTKTEQRLLVDLHLERLAHYRSNPAASAQLLAVGESPPPTTPRTANVAALADVCHILFNLSETLTRK